MAEHAAQVSGPARSAASSTSPTRATRGRGEGGGDLIHTLALRIEALVERHHAAKRKIDELHEAGDERERRIRELERNLQASKKIRVEVARRIDGLISQVEKLEATRA